MSVECHSQKQKRSKTKSSSGPVLLFDTLVLGSHAEKTVLHLGGVTISVETIGRANRLLGGFRARAGIAGGMTKTSNIQSQRRALAIKETNRISR
jgi:hypothetical protein